MVSYISDTIAVMYLGHIMEYGPAEALYDNPVHPYTLALFSAVPSAEPDDQQEHEALVGDVPSPIDPPPGCKFQGRCPLVEGRCREGEIQFHEVGNGKDKHLVPGMKITRHLKKTAPDPPRPTNGRSSPKCG